MTDQELTQDFFKYQSDSAYYFGPAELRRIINHLAKDRDGWKEACDRLMLATLEGVK